VSRHRGLGGNVASSDLEQVKIVTWNLGYWQFSRYHDEAWAYLRNQIQPDIALLQEVCVPKLADDELVIFNSIRKPWGTAVYAKGAKLQYLPTQEHPTRVAAALVNMKAGGNEFCVASIHAPIINGRVFPHLSTIFDEVELLVAGRTGVVGGDLNSARLAELVWPGHGHGPFFERLERGPFLDCLRRFHPEEIQTFFRADSLHPFQDDHLLVTPDLSAQLVSCDVLLNETTRRVSDHVPLVATFDL
jgi:exonuclease III